MPNSLHRRMKGGIFVGSRRQRGGKRRRCQRGGKRRSRRHTQRGGIPPLLIPLIAAGISAAGGIGSSAVHAALSR